MDNRIESLSRLLGGETPPQELASLEDQELESLVTSVQQLQRHQESELERALEDALSHIPALLRKSVRKMLFS